MIPQRVIDRVFTNIDISETGCWVSRYTGPHGYARVGWADSNARGHALVHRVAWIATNGPIPDGLTVDHIRGVCSSRKCVNPMHLRLLTHAENASDQPNKYKTHCPRGHPYDEANTYLDNAGKRRCRACVTEKSAEATELGRRNRYSKLLFAKTEHID